MDDSAIVTQGLRLRYAGTKRDALEPLDITVASGEFFGLVGPNGSGKSTTIALLCGQVAATAGTAEVSGIPVAGNGAVCDRRELYRRIGIMAEETALPEHLSGREFLEWCGTLHGLSPRESLHRADSLLAALDLSGAANRPIAGYSMGMKKKTALAAALLHRPRILFLDEPLNGVDVPSARVIRDLLARLATRSGTTIVLTSHILETIERLCDRIAVLRAGSLVALGDAAVLRAQANVGTGDSLEEAFIRLTRRDAAS